MILPLHTVILQTYGGLDSYERMKVEVLLSFADTLLNTINTAEIIFTTFDRKDFVQKYNLNKHSINSILKNHRQIPHLLEYKYYLTNTMNGEECHALLSALHGMSESWEDPSLKTDFYRFALMYAEAKQTGNKEKEKYYKAVMDALYEGYSSPELKDEGVNPEHIRELVKILD